MPSWILPGETLRLLFDATAGTLSPLPPVQPRDLSVETKQAQVLEIEVPTQVRAGQTIAVNVPGGHELTVCVSNSSASGSWLQLWYDPVAKTLTPLA